MTDYPYMVSNNKIAPIIAGIQTAAKPSKFTLEFLKNIGFSSTNDRAIVSLFKKLEILTDDSVPTQYYDQLRDRTTSAKILASRIKSLYSELFAINTDIQKENEGNIKGAISRVTGKDETSVTRIYNTFKTLCSIADFENKFVPEYKEEKKEEKKEETKLPDSIPTRSSSFHYNIQIHLPATTDISVYNAIFKSLKENLMI